MTCRISGFCLSEASLREAAPPQVARVCESIICWIAVKMSKNLYPQIYDCASLYAAWLALARPAAPHHRGVWG